MLYKSLPRSKPNRFLWQDNLVLHTSPHITCCFDFLPFCLSTQLMASLPAWVIRAECINLVFIYSPWIQHGRTKLEILLPFWQHTLSPVALSVKSGDLFITSRLRSWETSPGGDSTSVCGLGVSQPSIHASGCRVHFLEPSQNCDCQ